MAEDPVEARRELARRIDSALDESPLNAADVARQLNVDASTISNWRYGYRMPDPLDLARLCQVLGRSADYLLGIRDEPMPEVTLASPIGPHLYTVTPVLPFEVGAGADATWEGEKEPREYYALRTEWIRQQAIQRPAFARLSKGCLGKTMEPTIRAGAMLTLDLAVDAIRDGRIYIVKTPTEGLAVRRCYLLKMGRQLVCLSDNPHFTPLLLPIAKASIRDLVKAQVLRWSVEIDEVPACA